MRTQPRHESGSSTTALVSTSGTLWPGLDLHVGPPDKRPILPRWDVLDDLEAGEQYVVNDSTYAAHRDNCMPVVPYSWLHMNDNIMDPFHVQVLHSTFSVHQFAREFEIMPTVEFETIEAGLTY